VSYTLTNPELCDLTGRCRASAQARALEAMGIAFRRRRDGSIAVLRIHAETIPGVAAAATLPPRPQVNTDGL
jgi:hypothetical protein